MTQEEDTTTLERAYHEAGMPMLKDRATPFVWAVIALSALAVLAILVIFIVRPDRDNTALIAMVLAFLVPLVGGFLAAAIREVHASVNGRLSQLLLVTRRLARAEGRREATDAAADVATELARFHEAQRQLPPGALSSDAVRAEGHAAGVEQERTRTEREK
jgi:hypothetical protein